MLESVLRRYQRLPCFVASNFDSIQGHASDTVLIDTGTRRRFYHSGDLGDIIYALPAIRALGGGTLYLGPEIRLPFKVRTRQQFNWTSFEALAPLLRFQPY